MHFMESDILIFHPDITTHKKSSFYTSQIYTTLAELYTVKSFEWSIFRLNNKKIKIIFLFWFENLIGNPNNYLLQKIQYFLKIKYLRLAKLKGKKIVYGLHNRAPHNLDLNNASIANLYERFIKEAIGISDSIIVINTKTLEFFKETYGIDMDSKKVTHVPLGTTVPTRIERDKYRNRYNITDDDFFVGCIGRVERYKNIDLAITAFIKSNIPGKFIVAGKVDEGYEQELRSLANNNPNIIFDFRFLSDDEMIGLSQALDLMVLSYEKTSANSGVLIDAFLNRTNVLAYKFDLLYDYPEDCYYSYDYSDRDDHLDKLINGLQNAESEFHNDRKLYYSKCNRLKAVCESLNTWDNVKSKLIEAIN